MGTVLIVPGACTALGCGAHPPGAGEGTTEASSAPSIVAGLYRAEGGGPIEELNFYDESHYVSRKAGCSGAGCVGRGTFQIDRVTRQVTLRDEDSGAATTFDFGASDASPITASAKPAALHVLITSEEPGAIVKPGEPVQLVAKTGCRLVDVLQSPAGALKKADGGTSDFQNAMFAQMQLGARAVPDQPAWLTSSVSQAKSTCGPNAPAYRPPGLLTWNGLQLYDVVSCTSAEGPLGHTVYTPDGQAVMTTRHIVDDVGDDSWVTQQIIQPDSLAAAAQNTCKLLTTPPSLPPP